MQLVLCHVKLLFTGAVHGICLAKTTQSIPLAPVLCAVWVVPCSGNGETVKCFCRVWTAHNFFRCGAYYLATPCIDLSRQSPCQLLHHCTALHGNCFKILVRPNGPTSSFVSTNFGNSSRMRPSPIVCSINALMRGGCALMTIVSSPPPKARAARRGALCALSMEPPGLHVTTANFLISRAVSSSAAKPHHLIVGDVQESQHLIIAQLCHVHRCVDSSLQKPCCFQESGRGWGSRKLCSNCCALT